VEAERTLEMKRKRHSPEEVIRKLREADGRLANGESIAQVCRDLGVSETTYHRWKNQFGGMKAPEAKRLRELEKEKENTRLRIVAEQALDNQILKEVAEGNFWGRPGDAPPYVTCSSASQSPSAGHAKSWVNPARGRTPRPTTRTPKRSSRR
jgi:putative transposase